MFGDFLLDGRQALLRRIIFLPSYRFSLDFELFDASFDRIEFLRHRIDLDAEFRCCLIDEVNRLVRQKAIGDVAVAELGRSDDRTVGDSHAVMHFVPFLQAPQNGNRVFHIRFGDQDGLEPTFQRRVFFDVLTVLVDRGCANRPKSASRKRRLEHVRCIDRPLGRAGADQRVQLVDKEDNFPFRFFDFF